MTHRVAYHHGALAPALLAAVEDVVAEQGVGGLSLGEVARRPGVSHTGAWSIVHGFATLWIDGNFGPSVAARPPVEAADAAFGAFGATLMPTASGGTDD